MIILSQRDPRWATLKLGISPLTVGRYGCTTTCVSMLTDYFWCYTNPAQLAGQKDLYTKDGLILWNNLEFRKMRFVNRFYMRDDEKIADALKDPDKAVILEVANRSHWVVGLRPTYIGDSYVVADPWSGDKCDVIKRYKNITGGAYFARI